MKGIHRDFAVLAGTMKLSCECLNVKIHCRGTELQPTDISTLDLNTACQQEGFFNLKLSLVQLDLEGITQEHTYLVQQKTASDWKIFRCMNCETFTHATRRAGSSDQVLVNTDLLKVGSATERLGESSDFSSLFGVVLRGRENDNHPIREHGIQADEFESLQHTLADIQQRLNSYLIEEENSMEERIRRYEEEQRAEFAELQSRARRDKNNMMSLVLSTSNDANGFSSQTSPPRSPVVVPSPTHSTDNITSGPNNNRRLATGDTDISQSKISPVSTKVSRQMVDTGLDPSDPLFDVDIFDDSNDPFYESDEEDEVDDDSTSDDLQSSAESGFSAAVYSTSVPISVPLWKTQKRRTSHREYVEDERKKTPPPENMAASMQALARSVHGDGTEIFGDRPRPRLSTLDMSQISRPRHY